MPRPNRGASLKYNSQRQKYYIVWYEVGLKMVRSTGTSDAAKAAEVLEAFNIERGDLPYGRRPVAVAFDEVGPVRPQSQQWVYFIGSDAGPIKIGIAENVERRLRSLRMASPVPLTLLAKVQGDITQEWFYHQHFHKHRLHGEWFSPAKPILNEIAAINAKAA